MTRADIDDLRRRLDDLGKTVKTARVDVNDKAAQAKLLLLARQFDRLNKRVTPEIDLKGFVGAEVQLAAMERSLDRLTGGAGGGGGLIGKLASGFSNWSVGVVSGGPQVVLAFAAITAV